MKQGMFLFVCGIACGLFAGRYWTFTATIVADSMRQREKLFERRHLLPIIPKNSGSSALQEFFSKYPSDLSRSSSSGGDDDNDGWIDANNLNDANVKHLRKLATDIMGKDTRCGYPRLNREEGGSIPPEMDVYEYCMWDADLVSSSALANFGFETNNWMWVSRAFEDLHKRYNVSDHTHDKCKQQQENRLGFLDIGVNVGDWISPLRLLHPEVPIYGVEGSPSTAAIAAANLKTSVSFHQRSKNVKTDVAPSKLLPFSLATFAQVESIRENGGVCFSKPGFSDETKEYNIGGRSVNIAQRECPPSDVAGATTLEHALRSLVDNDKNNNNDDQCQKTLDWPKIYIAKFDVEGFEFKAISSVIPWLSTQPPCYVIIEYWHGRPSCTAFFELLLDMEYDSVWLPGEGYPDVSEPWWNLERDGGNFQQRLFDMHIEGCIEVIFGFQNVDKCIQRIAQA